MTWSNMPFSQLMPLMWQGTLETLYMTLVSTLIAYVLGLPLGILLITTERDSLTPAPAFNKVLGTITQPAPFGSLPYIDDGGYAAYPPYTGQGDRLHRDDSSAYYRQLPLRGAHG